MVFDIAQTYLIFKHMPHGIGLGVILLVCIGLGGQCSLGVHNVA
jgi:hypothetical protein